MDIVENKLDEDFLFYLGFIRSYLQQMSKEEEANRCRAWLYKLCGQTFRNVNEKRNRNIYLSNLVLCMQEDKLKEPFLQSPADNDLSDAMDVFGNVPSELKEPEWLTHLVEDVDEDDLNPRDGRTYLATRTLPGGEGAFAYIAVTLADDEPKWLGGGEGVFEQKMEEKFKEYVPPVTEMERILLRRKDPAERQRVLAFYDALLQNINSELEGDVDEKDNVKVNEVMEQLKNDLQKKGEYQAIERMEDEKQKRTELLLMLHERVLSRRNKIVKREDVLDDLEKQTLPVSFFELSAEMQDKVELPAAMWEQIINKAPNKKNMDHLFEHYPHNLIEKFLELLANEKEDIAMRLQKRHENIVSQMRKELRKDADVGRVKCEDAEREWHRIQPVLEAVKAAYNEQIESERNLVEHKRAAMTEQAQLYEQMHAALLDTQRGVEEEAERGRQLREQINSVNERTELYQQVNDESIRKTEAANIALMRNIKRLRNAVKQYESRISQIKSIAEKSTKSGKSSEEFFVF